MDKKEAEELVKDARLKLEKAEKILAESKREPWNPWRPKYGPWSLGGDGKVAGGRVGFYVQHGAAFQTEEQAKELSRRQGIFNRTCQLAFELNPSGKLVSNYEVYWSHGDVKFRSSSQGSAPQIACVFETNAAAEKAVEIMNEDKEYWKIP